MHSTRTRRINLDNNKKKKKERREQCVGRRKKERKKDRQNLKIIDQCKLIFISRNNKRDMSELSYIEECERLSSVKHKRKRSMKKKHVRWI